MTRKHEPRLLSCKQVASLLSCSQPTVRRLVKEKKLTAPKVLTGKVMRWFPGDVRLYLARLRRGDFDET